VNILLVEDSAIERQQIGWYLNEWNLEFAVATDGIEAWSYLQSPDAPNLAPVFQ
jgi:DNA-binding response OmpR family regulator